jgi:hypothetical protein
MVCGIDEVDMIAFLENAERTVPAGYAGWPDGLRWESEVASDNYTEVPSVWQAGYGKLDRVKFR